MTTLTTLLEPETLSVDLDGRVVEFEVRWSERARTTRIQLGRDVPLRIIVPAGASRQHAMQALRNKAPWVLNKLHEVEQQRQRKPELGLARAGCIWLHGEPIPVMTADVRHAQLSDGTLLVPDVGAEAAIRRWYRRSARKWLQEMVSREATRLGVTVTDVGVRDQRTRWGSCSRHGHVSLNWRLLLVPEHVARYVVIHELVHLRVPNHSKAFWRNLATVLPEWRAASHWLDRHGDELRQYEPAAPTP